MCGKGNGHDNPAVEIFFNALKAELVWRRNGLTRRAVEITLFTINRFYHPRRKPSAGDHPWPSHKGRPDTSA